MGLLSEFITEQDQAFDETKLTYPKKYKRGALADFGLGAVSGVAKGVTSVSNAASRFVEGDEVADKRMQQVNEAFTPLNQGTAGHIASGITEVVAAGTVGAPLGPYGMAATVGLGTRAIEHTKLTQQLGVDQDTADTASNIYGATNAALAFLPVSNVFKKSLVADYAALVVAPTAVGQGLTYAEGAYLDHKGYEKQGAMYKDMATDPNAIFMNLAIGSTFYAAGRYMNAKGNADLPEAEVHKAEADFNATVEQAQTDADVSSMPNIAETIDDLAQHEANLNQAIDQVMKGEKVNISEATGGKLKTLDDVKKHIQTNQKKQPTLEELSNKVRSSISSGLANNSSNNAATKPFTATGTKKTVYDEAMKNGFTDADARTIVALAHFESGGTFSPTIKNKKSSATGVFQFIDSTWTSEGGTAANRHDLNTQIKLGIKHTKSNIKYIEDKTGVVLTGSQIYIPHLLGRGGAEIVFKEIRNNPDQSARSVISKFSKNPDRLMSINGIPKNSTIGDAVHFFTKRIDDITAKHYGGTGSSHRTVFESDTDSTIATEQAPIKPESSYEGTVDRLDLDNLPHADEAFISAYDVNAFHQKGAWNEVVGDLTNEHMDLPSMVLDKDGNLVPESEIDVPRPVHNPELDLDFDKLLNELFETVEQTTIPHTAKGVRVKDDILNPTNQEFKPDSTIATEWKEKQRWENNKYHKELTRSYTDKDGNLVQELQYRGSYVRRTVDRANRTAQIHIGRSGRSDFVDHKGNKELETALDRIFDEGRAFGYLSQIPKGQQTIDKLVANPDLVISSKKTGEDLTAAQWKDKLIREQDNIQMMAKTMSTLAKCALKQAA